MTVRFRDQFTSHRSVDGLSDTAFRLYVTSVDWAAANTTDGLVPREDLGLVCARVRAPERFAAECVRRGAWHDARHDCESVYCPGPFDEDGWVIHDYLKEMPSKEQAEAGEAGMSDGGRLGNHRRWHEARGVSDPGCQWCEQPPKMPPEGRSSGTRSGSDRVPDRAGESGANPRMRADFDFDFDLDPQSQISQSKSKSDARAREPDAELIAAVAEAIQAKIGYRPDDDQARTVIAEIRERARKAGKRIRDPMKYFPAAVANEPDLYRWLVPDEPPHLAAILAVAPPPPDSHQYEHNPDTWACAACDYPKAHVKHQAAS